MSLVLVVVEKNTRNAMGKTLKKLMLCILATVTYEAQAQVTVDIDQSIERKLTMKNAQIDTNKISGFRIQIAFDSDGGVTSKASNKFKSKFPEYSDRVYNLYQQPSYKVRVGDFAREIEAQSLLAEVREYFPNAFIVKDYIRTPNWSTKYED